MTASGAERPGMSTPAVTQATAPPTNGLLRTLLEGALERGAEARFEVDGASMLPLIRPHDVVHMRVTTIAALHPGEVVAVRGANNAGVLVHRVVASAHGRLVLRGDNCRHEDGCYGQEDIIGVVTRVERRGRVAWFGAGPLGRAVALAVRAGLVWRANRVFYAARRRLGTTQLKFHLRATRLRQHKGDDGNE